MEHQDQQKPRLPWYLSTNSDEENVSPNDLDKKIEGMESHIGRIRNGLNQLQEQLRQLRDQLESGKNADNADEEEQDNFSSHAAIAN